MGRKVIITCALVGSATRKNQNPNTPYSPKELAEAAHLAYKAGAAMVHVHAIEDDGTNSTRVERIKEGRAAIKEKTPELEVYSTAGIDNYYFLAPSGNFTDPVNFNFVWGVCGGAAFRPATFVGMASSLPPGANFSTCGVGNEEWPAITQAILCGGHVRVGLEDNVRMPNGELAKGNYELVENAVRIIEALGCEPATPDEARNIFGIKKK